MWQCSGQNSDLYLQRAPNINALVILDQKYPVAHFKIGNFLNYKLLMLLLLFKSSFEILYEQNDVPQLLCIYIYNLLPANV